VGYYGSDSFDYSASDTIDASTGTVSIRVNTPPVAVDDSYSVLHDRTLSVLAATGVLANDTDPDGDTLTATVVSLPSHGTLTLNGDGHFTYQPAAGFAGTDSFSYAASDGVDAPHATVAIDVLNAPPVAVNDNYVIDVNASQSGNVLANDSDADGDTLTASL